MNGNLKIDTWLAVWRLCGLSVSSGKRVELEILKQIGAHHLAVDFVTTCPLHVSVAVFLSSQFTTRMSYNLNTNYNISSSRN